jgi:hypothetical protein
MKLSVSVTISLRKIANGFWVSREEGKPLCDLKLAERGQVYGYVLTQAGIDALKSSTVKPS